MMMTRNVALALAVLLTGTVWTHRADANLSDVDVYYIGRDKLATFTSGTYSGLANPNHNRLTFLLAHGDHYHSKSRYILTGPASNPVVQPFPSSNFLPEPSAGTAFELRPGTGPFAGKFRSGLGLPGEEQWDFRIRSVDYLSSFASGSPQNILFNSSSGRWNGSLAGSELRLHVHSISPGLKIADQMGNLLLDGPGQSYLLGDALSLDFTPVMYVESTATPGNYFARFTLSDQSSVAPWLPSGEFEFRFRFVPEPAWGIWGLIALIGLSARRR